MDNNTRKQNIIPGEDEARRLQKIPFRIVHVSSIIFL